MGVRRERISPHQMPAHCRCTRTGWSPRRREATLLAQLLTGSAIGVHVVLLRGYGSQTYVDDVVAMVDDDGRPAGLIYAATSTRRARTSCATSSTAARCSARSSTSPSAPTTRHSRSARQPRQSDDSRAAAFVARHGALHAVHDFGRDQKGRHILVQVEVEAIAPDVLRRPLRGRPRRLRDTSVYDAVLARERTEPTRRLVELAGSCGGEP